MTPNDKQHAEAENRNAAAGPLREQNDKSPEIAEDEMASLLREARAEAEPDDRSRIIEAARRLTRVSHQQKKTDDRGS